MSHDHFALAGNAGSAALDSAVTVLQRLFLSLSVIPFPLSSIAAAVFSKLISKFVI